MRYREHLNELPTVAHALLSQSLEAIRKISSFEAKSWTIPSTSLARASPPSLCADVRAWAKGRRCCIYTLSVDNHADLAALERAYCGAASSKARAYAQINAPSACLYVGSSRTVAQRLKEHLGYQENGRTYALQMRHWMKGLDLDVEFTCAAYSSETPADVIYLLEGCLWDRLKPMFGQKGQRTPRARAGKTQQP